MIIHKTTALGPTELNVGEISSDGNLKPCPFCGAVADLVQEEDYHGKHYTLGCSDKHCPAYWIYYTEGEIPLDKAVKMWNMRTPAGV